MIKPFISIVLGTFNQKEVLEKVLFSLSEQTMPSGEYEVVVIDSTSTDGTIEFLKSFKPPCHFQHIILENRGKTAARNEGIKQATGDIIIITDGDMIADKNFVKAHFEAHQKSNTPTCFEGVTYNMKKLEWPTNFSNLTTYIKGNYKNLSKLGWWYFLTGNISFPKYIFEQASGFDEDFLGYGWEDLELGYRLAAKKIPLRYLKKAINFHYHVLTEEEEIQREVNKGKSARVFLQKHPKLKWFLGLNPVSVFAFNRIKKDGAFYKLIEQKCYKSKISFLNRLGFWFLKEYNYLEGIL